jgi:hypothetical protein
VCRGDIDFVRYTELGQGLRSLVHDFEVGVAAHDDGDEGFVGHKRKFLPGKKSRRRLGIRANNKLQCSAAHYYSSLGVKAPISCLHETHRST